jgi:DMSO/TMAO reductase YedYZ heme-binding membrane subunit
MKKTDLTSKWNEIDIYWIEFEYLKHLTTVSTGAILLLVAFLEKIFKQPEYKPAIAVSLVSFLVSIMLCAMAQTSIIEKASEKKNESWRDKVQNLTVTLCLLALLCFIVGMISLVIFGLKNLF